MTGGIEMESIHGGGEVCTTFLFALPKDQDNPEKLIQE